VYQVGCVYYVIKMQLFGERVVSHYGEREMEIATSLGPKGKEWMIPNENIL
jgi:hypothetical protein